MTNERVSKNTEGKQQSEPGPVRGGESRTRPEFKLLHQLQQTLGNRACALFIQAKLNVSQPGDHYEQEADRVADAVMAGQDSPIGHVSHGVQPKLYRMELRPEDLVDSVAAPGGELQGESPETPIEEVQRSANGDAGGQTTAHFERSLGQAAGGGVALPSSTRSFMESRFGRDFSSVRVHSDARADTLARAVNARAFTLDSDIFFSGSEYRPDSTEGQHLLAHELTHVVQQSDGRLSRQIQRITRCSSYPGYTAAALNTYNCAGLATRTYQNIPTASATYNSIMANFVSPGSPSGTSCVPGAVKFWLWEYEMRIEDDQGTIIQQRDPQGNLYTSWRDYHVVAGRTDVGTGADPTDVYSKNGFRRVHGPGSGPGFQPAARERALTNDASETPVTINGRPWFKVRTNMSEQLSCAGCYP